MPSCQAKSEEDQFEALQCYAIFCVNHKRALLAEYGVAEEKEVLKSEVPMHNGPGESQVPGDR